MHNGTAQREQYGREECTSRVSFSALWLLKMLKCTDFLLWRANLPYDALLNT